MKKLLALLVVALSSVTLHAQTVWTEENIDPDTGLRTGVIEVNGSTFRIGPNAHLSFADLSGADLSGANLIEANLDRADLSFADLSRADLTDANISGPAILIGANLSGANLKGRLFGADLGWLYSAFSRGNYEEIQALKPQVETNTTRGEQQALQIAELQAQAPTIQDNRATGEVQAQQIAELQAQAPTIQDNRATGEVQAQQIAELEALTPAIIANTAKVGITAEQATAIESNTAEINELRTMVEAMSVQMQQLNARLDDQQASIEERDQQIAELSQRPTLAEVQDARPGSLVFRADEETNSVTLEFEIQSSENLQDWVAQPETVTATVPLDAEKKFVRIALAQE